MKRITKDLKQGVRKTSSLFLERSNYPMYYEVKHHDWLEKMFQPIKMNKMVEVSIYAVTRVYTIGRV